VHIIGWSKGLEVTADGEGIVSHAGPVLLRQLADKNRADWGAVGGAGLGAAVDP
jgi:hypothetical protein